MKGVVALALSALIAGCSGTLTTTALAPDVLATPGAQVKGVVFYPPAYFFEVSQTTTLVDAQGKVVGRALDRPPACMPIELKKLAIHPDYAHPQLLQYEHGLLESYKLSAELDSGLLKSVNVESTPDQGKTISNLASAAKDVAAIAAAGGVPPCNDGPALIRLERYDFPK